MQKVDIQALAKYLTLRFEVEGECLTPAKLQKLLYYVQAWHLVHTYGHPLFEDQPQAWVNGPVYTSIYGLYKGHQMYDCISSNGLDGADATQAALETAYKALGLDEKQADIVESVIRSYGFLPSNKLISMTHSEAPWADAREGLSPVDRSNKRIEHSAMREYYSKRIAG